MDLGAKIQDLRKRKGMSQEQLADHLGVTRQSISKWELNTSVPDIEKLKTISRLFDVSLDELLDNEAIKEAPGERPSAPPESQGPQYLGRIERLIKKKGYKFGYGLIGWGAVTLLILIGFTFIFISHLRSMGEMFGNFGGSPGLDMFPEFTQGTQNTFGLFGSLTGVMSLVPFLLMIIPAAMIILGIVIAVKGKKYGESIE